MDAKPLCVTVDVGPYAVFQDGAKVWAWGIRSSIEAHIAYKICDATDPSIELAALDVTFQNRLAISLEMSPYTGARTNRAARLDKGKVVVEFEPCIREDE